MATTALADPSATRSEVTEHEFIAELPVVLSVSRLAQSLRDTPAAVTVIDREMIRASGARELADLFRLVPGFTVARPLSAGTVVTYHGMTETFPRRMQVLIDGRSQYSPFYFGGIEWNLIPVALDDIERIEVVRGSNSAAYGANAFLGVANIITRSGLGMPTGLVELRSGQAAYGDAVVRLAGGKEKLSWRLTGSNSNDNGIDRVRDDRRRRVVDGRFDFRPTAQDQFGLRFGQSEAWLQVGAGSSGNPLRSENKWQDFLQINWQRTLDENSDIAVRYFRSQDHARDGFVTSKGPLIVPIDYTTNTTRDDLELQHTVVPDGTTRLVWGLGGRLDSVRAPAFFGGGPEVTNSVLRAFGNLEWRPADFLTVNLGSTLERDRRIGSTNAPRLFANLHLPGKGGTLRLGVARAYRAPSLLETNGNQIFVATNGAVVQHGFIGQSGLRPESLLSREIGYLNQLPGYGIAFDLRLFNERVRDRIDVYQAVYTAPYCDSPPTAIPLPYCALGSKILNFADAEIRGLEYRFDWRPRPATRLTLQQSFIAIHPVSTGPIETYPGLLLPRAGGFPEGQQQAFDLEVVHQRESAPTHATMLSWVEKLPFGLELSATYWWQGAMKWTTNTRAPTYRRLDWRLAAPFRAGPSRGELAFAVQGDGAERSEYSSATSLGKRGFVSLRLEY